MHLSKKKLIIISLGLIVCVALVSYLLRDKVLQRTYLRPKTGDVIESIYGLGTVTSGEVFHLKTSIPLSVKKIFVEEGGVVSAGEALVRFEDITLRSSINGIVTSVKTEVGEVVTPQVVILTVTNFDKLFLEVSLEQQSVLRIKKEQSVLVSFENLRHEKYQGLVKSVYSRDNQFIVRIIFLTKPSGILPGMTADVAILVGKKTNVLLVPLKSIVAGKIIRVRGKHKDRVSVKLGIIEQGWGEVLEGAILPTDQLQMRN